MTTPALPGSPPALRLEGLGPFHSHFIQPRRVPTPGSSGVRGMASGGAVYGLAVALWTRPYLSWLDTVSRMPRCGHLGIPGRSKSPRVPLPT